MIVTRRFALVAGASALATAAMTPYLRATASGVVADIRMRSDELGSRVFFDPIGLHIPVGSKVRWICEASLHTATAYHPSNGNRARRIPKGAKPWDSGYLSPGDEFAVTLTQPGVYDFFCQPHERAGMVGRIVVGNVDVDAATDGYGERAVSAAALQAFPSVGDIVAQGAVSPVAGNG
ncbi:plastocyanin/azurin family copper-binding protein [Ferruginivarius sediminum]|uniref:Blue (type 1) copper domain-containing protein n=1 Tax=Ferruginivarius sediminum TaxID=2661937 RepID=A0A369T958_9PROT|nr:plastocyanin/azurin family copper-binding protein [Ferruginivarius sediminum]RDD61859.1 hypothetical protein DRB17_10200 [Ferruginivarius sediminum]